MGRARREKGLPRRLWWPQHPVPQGREEDCDRQRSGGERSGAVCKAGMGAGGCRAPWPASSADSGRRGPVAAGPDEGALLTASHSARDSREDWATLRVRLLAAGWAVREEWGGGGTRVRALSLCHLPRS